MKNSKVFIGALPCQYFVTGRLLEQIASGASWQDLPHDRGLLEGSAVIAKAFAFSLATNDPVPPIEGLTLVPGAGTFRLRMSRRSAGSPRAPRPLPQPLSSAQLLASDAADPDDES